MQFNAYGGLLGNKQLRLPFLSEWIISGKKWPWSIFKRSVKMMKFTVVLLSLFCFGANAKGIGQRVSLSENTASLKKIFREIESQTGYQFFFSDEDLRRTKAVNLHVHNESLNEVLQQCFADQPLTFEIIDKTVVMKRKRVVPPSPVPLTVSINTVPPQPNIHGFVRDSTGAPMGNVAVMVKGTHIATVTDDKGYYVLAGIDASKVVLIFKFLGYENQEVELKGRTVVNISLKEITKQLDDISVTVNTGIFNKAKESYTGAARVISSKELERFQGHNIFVTIGNIDPSFYVLPDNNVGSDPNHIPDVQLRGTRNLPNIDQLQSTTASELNTPLIILDGFPTTLQRMMDLNNNEIASVTLLKDGSATALYGSRGANGVIVIATKKPAGGKLRLTYKGETNLNMPDLSSYHLLNAAEKLQLEVESGYYVSATKTAAQNIDLQQYYNQIKALVESGVNTDWMAKPLHTQADQNHTLRLEGGDQAFTYALEGQFNRINGVMKGSDRQTINATVDIAYNLKKLNFRNTMMVTSMSGNESPWGSFSDYVKLNPYWSPTDSAGHIVQSFTPFDWNYWTQTSKYGNNPVPNPAYDATLNGFNKSGYTTITNNFQVEWRPESHLSLRGGAGITTTTSTSDDFKSAANSAFAGYSDADILRKGSYAYGSGKALNYTANLTANYSNIFAGRHELTIGASADLTQDKTSNYLFNAEGFPDESIDFIGAALQYQLNGTPQGTEATTRRVGLVTNLNYIYNKRYFVDLAYRVDGASQFGTDKRFAPFWSAGAGWNLQNESFFKNLRFVNRLKLRGSYGVTGNQQFSAYQPLATYTYITGDHYENWLGATQTALGNPDLKWQKTGKYDVGLESSLFKDRLMFQADVYEEKTSNLLSSLELPYSNGFTSYVENIGRLSQHGWELMVTVMLLQKHGLNWSVTGNITHDADKIVQLSEAMKAANEKLALETDGSTPNTIILEGASQNTIYAVRSLGIDPSTGKELFLNHDGQVTYTWNAADRVAVGLSQPKYRGNFSTLFRYRSFALNASFSFRFGGQLYNQTLIDKVENADRLFNVDERVFHDRWTKPGDVTFFRGINETSTVYPSSRFVQNESTLTWQNLNLSYDMTTQAWLHHVGLKALTLAANTGELFYLSTVKQERGLDYPFTRQVSLSVFAQF
jgi:TonB-linked SusC/RagA family outer membrane protein